MIVKMILFISTTNDKNLKTAIPLLSLFLAFIVYEGKKKLFKKRPPLRLPEC